MTSAATKPIRTLPHRLKCTESLALCVPGGVRGGAACEGGALQGAGGQGATLSQKGSCCRVPHPASCNTYQRVVRSDYLIVSRVVVVVAALAREERIGVERKGDMEGG